MWFLFFSAAPDGGSDIAMPGGLTSMLATLMCIPHNASGLSRLSRTLLDECADTDSYVMCGHELEASRSHSSTPSTASAQQ